MNSKWNPHETQYLIENYSNQKISDIAIHLNKTYKSVKRKAERIGLKQGKRQDWTTEEIETLIANFELPLSKLSSMIPNHSPGSILSKGYGIGLFRQNPVFADKTRINPKGNNAKNRKVYRNQAEKLIKRKLVKNESVHHIDCDNKNNRQDNLHVFESYSDHRRAHSSIERLVKPLLEKGIIEFDRDEGLYRLSE